MDLRALTFNIRYDTVSDGPNAWGFRKERAIDLVRSQRCHVVGFQEVLAHQREDLELALRGYIWLGQGRDADRSGEQCCLAIDPSFEILDTGTFWLCPTPEIPGSVGWDAQLTRICTWASLARAGKEFTVFNAHWDHRGQLARTETARLLMDRVLTAPHPVLLMGDFNTPPDSEPIALLTTVLQDTFAVVHPSNPAGTFHGFGQTPNSARIDYLLASPEFLIIDSQIVDEPGPYASDHFAVYGSYELL
jgi:endonuclease/exonuclease/phosphatase family metal-dependent hydrolase